MGGEECRQKKVDLRVGGFLKDFVFYDVSKVRVKVDKKKSETLITFTRIKNDRWDPEPNMLLTLPQISMCKLTPIVKLSAAADVPIEIVSDQKSFLTDKIKIKDDEVHLYYKKKLVLSIAAEGWYIKAEKEKDRESE